MTDIPRGQGGDGSPQLDLDAIKRRPAKSGGWAFDAVQETVSLSRKERDGLLALVRRLQQEVTFLTDALRCDSVALERVSDERDAARGRVEELTEALRKYGVHKTGCTMNSLQRATGECVCGLGALLARVDPEKETPLKKNEAPVKFVCAECGQAGVAEYHPYLYCELFKLGHADQEQYLAAYGFTRKTAR